MHKATRYNYGNGATLRPVTINCTPETLRLLERFQEQEAQRIGRKVSRSLGLAILVKDASTRGLIQ